MEEEIVLLASGRFPEQRKRGRVAAGEEPDMRVRGEEGEERGRWSTAQRGRIQGVDEEVNWSGRGGSSEMVENGGDYFARLGTEFREERGRAIVDCGGNRGKNLPDSKGWGVAVYYYYFGRG